MKNMDVLEMEQACAQSKAAGVDLGWKSTQCLMNHKEINTDWFIEPQAPVSNKPDCVQNTDFCVHKHRCCVHKPIVFVNTTVFT